MKNLKKYTEFNESVEINELYSTTGAKKTEIGEFDGKYLKVRVNHTDYEPNSSLIDFVVDRNWDGSSNHNIGASAAKNTEEEKALAQEFYKDLSKLAETFDKGIDKLRKKYK